MCFLVFRLLQAEPVPGTRRLWTAQLHPSGGQRAHGRDHQQVSAANRLIGEVVQSRRRPLLGPSPG